jgi:hypothetical protein
MQQGALVAVNTSLTIRNWLIGFYFVEFEQKGEDRAKYGEKLLQNLADKLNEDGFSFRNLYLFRGVFLTYPQFANSIREILQLPVYESIEILQSLTAKLNNESSSIEQTVSAQFGNDDSTIGQALSAQLQTFIN